MEKEIFVYLDFSPSPLLVGRLWVRARKQSESASFEYDHNWLKHPDFFALEPALMADVGVHHTADKIRMFGSLGKDFNATRRTSARNRSR
jgi:serine/threonine-protein kinase HipA